MQHPHAAAPATPSAVPPTAVPAAAPAPSFLIVASDSTVVMAPGNPQVRFAKPRPKLPLTLFTSSPLARKFHHRLQRATRSPRV